MMKFTFATYELIWLNMNLEYACLNYKLMCLLVKPALECASRTIDIEIHICQSHRLNTIFKCPNSVKQTRSTLIVSVTCLPKHFGYAIWFSDIHCLCYLFTIWLKATTWISKHRTVCLSCSLTHPILVWQRFCSCLLFQWCFDVMKSQIHHLCGGENARCSFICSRGKSDIFILSPFQQIGLLSR